MPYKRRTTETHEGSKHKHRKSDEEDQPASSSKNAEGNITNDYFNNLKR